MTGLTGTCPTCGTAHPLEDFINDAFARRALAVGWALPQGVGRHLIHYLSLFRKGKTGPTWPRIEKLLLGLRDLVEAQSVTWDDKPPRPNSPNVWIGAMEKIVCNRPKRLPLENHNYLRRIAWDIADQQDAARERDDYDAAVNRSHAAAPLPDEECVGPEEIGKMVQDFKKRHGVGAKNLSPSSGDDAPANEEDRG